MRVITPPDEEEMQIGGAGGFVRKKTKGLINAVGCVVSGGASSSSAAAPSAASSWPTYTPLTRIATLRDGVRIMPHPVPFDSVSSSPPPTTVHEASPSPPPPYVLACIGFCGCGYTGVGFAQAGIIVLLVIDSVAERVLAR